METIPLSYQRSEAKRRLAGRVHAISAMLKAATDELVQAAHDEALFVDAGRVDDLGDPLNRVAAGLSANAERARSEIGNCLRILELWVPIVGD